MMNLDSFAEENSKQSMEIVAWFLLAAYSPIPEERDQLRALLNKKELALGDQENFLPVQIPKNENVGSGENTKNVGEPTSARDEECDSWIQSANSAGARTRNGITQEESVENPPVC